MTRAEDPDQAPSANGNLNRFRLDGGVAAITGGASGIGLAAARMFAEAGASVIILDRDETAADAAASAIANARAMTLDVADEQSVTDVFSSIDANGGLDYLVNCAGIALRRPALEHSVADWNQVVAVNMTGTFLCARAAAAIMTARDAGSGSGSGSGSEARSGFGPAIVNTASIMGLSGGGLYPNISYQTTKGAIVNMTRALAVEWAGCNIRVNAVAPTYVKTPFIAALLDQPHLMDRIEAMTPLGRLADPEDVAAAIVFLCSPAAAMITGHTLPVDGGFLAV